MEVVEDIKEVSALLGIERCVAEVVDDDASGSSDEDIEMVVDEAAVGEFIEG